MANNVATLQDTKGSTRSLPLPRDPAFDATLPILSSDGYRYISNRCRELNSDIFRTRLLFRPSICFLGEDAAKTFYDSSLLRRHGAAPKRIRKSLLGEGGVHGLDDPDHRHRKEMFLSLMQPARLEALNASARAAWQRQCDKWSKRKRVSLQTEAQEILCRAVCEWSGVPLSNDLPRRARDLAAMVDSFGAVGPRFWRGTRARRHTEAWIRRVIRGVRKGKIEVPADTAAHIIATHRQLSGKLLDEKVGAVELINVLRPTVAVSYFVVFCALALHQYPEEKRTLQGGDPRRFEYFVHEVRRFYPFAPVMGAIAKRDFEWHGYRIRRGMLVVLDLYGTNHDPRIWGDPDEFRPGRFEHWNGSAFNFVPQGGGDHASGHRCAGEWMTINLLKIALEFLTTRIDYEVLPQDLSVSLRRIPTKPRDGFLIKVKKS